MKKTFVKIISALALTSVVGSSLFGCMAEKDNSNETDPADTTFDGVIDGGNSFEDYLAEEEPEFYRIDDLGGGKYNYYLYNEDGSVAEEMEGCEIKPEITVTESSLVRVTMGRETYYYDLVNQVFSETFIDAFDEMGTLLVMANGRKIVVCDIYDENGLNKEFDDFHGGLTWSVSGDETPFVDAEFIQDGASIKVTYISGERDAQYSQCFDIGSGSKFVVIDKWTDKLEAVTTKESDDIINYLSWYIGKVDSNTGYEFIYKVSGTLMMNGDKYTHCQCFYKMVTEDGKITEVPAAEFVLSEHKTERYDCREGTEEELIVYTENNMM